MSNFKKQHYVPQCYLQNFSSNGISLFVFDKPTIRTFESSIAKVAQEKYFYNANSQDIKVTEEAYQQDSKAFLKSLEQIIENSQNPTRIKQFQAEMREPNFEEKLYEIATNPQYLETKILAPHEGKLAQLLREVAREIRVRERIKQNHKTDLAMVMAIQVFRTPKYRYENIELQEKVMTELIKIQPGYNSEDELRVFYDREFEDRITSSALLNPEYFVTLATIFRNHIWQIGVNNTSQPLYTSDSPVVKHGHLSTFIEGVGFASLGVEVAYPISPSVILLLYDRSFFDDKIKRENRCITLTEAQVAFYNGLQITQSRRQIYSVSEAFSQAIEMCNQNPNLREVDQYNIHVRDEGDIISIGN